MPHHSELMVRIAKTFLRLLVQIYKDSGGRAKGNCLVPGVYVNRVTQYEIHRLEATSRG
jgi:hypothetical protein